MIIKSLVPTGELLMKIILPVTSSDEITLTEMEIPHGLWEKLRVVSNPTYSRHGVKGLLRVFTLEYPNPTVEKLESFVDERLSIIIRIERTQAV